MSSSGCRHGPELEWPTVRLRLLAALSAKGCRNATDLPFRATYLAPTAHASPLLHTRAVPFPPARCTTRRCCVPWTRCILWATATCPSHGAAACRGPALRNATRRRQGGTRADRAEGAAPRVGTGSGTAGSRWGGTGCGMGWVWCGKEHVDVVHGRAVRATRGDLCAELQQCADLRVMRTLADTDPTTCVHRSPPRLSAPVREHTHRAHG